MIRCLLSAVLCVFLFSCNQKGSEINKFTNDVFIRVADYQDRRLPDSLIRFLDDKNAEYRNAAVLAFASIQDTTFSEIIGRLFVSDPDLSVRSAAAFALGQTGGSVASKFLLNGPNEEVGQVLSEALGKAIKKAEIPFDLTSWGYYRLAIRGLADSSHVALALGFLQPNYAEDLRLGAAHFFNRGPSEIGVAEQTLLNLARNDPSAYVRMAAASALRKIKKPLVRDALMDMFGPEKDYRVRINILRALQSYSLIETSEVFFSALHDNNQNVSIASSEVIRQSARPEDFTALIDKARTSLNWRVKANLYSSALAVSGQKELSEEIVELCENAVNPYEKAALIGALSDAPMQYGYVSDQLLNSNIPVVKSSAASALVAMNKHKLFRPDMQKSFLNIYKRAMQTNDPAVIGTVVTALTDHALGYENLISDLQFLYKAKENLTLPKDNEALQPLEAAIAYFEGRQAPIVKNEFNNPIDWAFVKSIPRDQRVVVKTAKGSIEMQLFVEEAPGSVANFILLAQAGYFNAKNFHRVVPNFVIQGGCNRGDGWGSEEYSIRSEFSMRKYKEGSVGMASAGKDTEGTQWFITHSPTPHLDGRYTIFAEVVNGMEVVHRIEVGDQILSVEILKP